jgi:uncharacterized protein (TIGR02147 family)
LSIEYYPQDSRHYLKFEFEARKKRRPYYSLRAFARDLEISPSALSEYFNGKLTFSEERILQVSQKIQLKPVQTEHWIDLIKMENSPSKADREVASVKVRARASQEKGNIALGLFQIISDWYHYALLELIDIDLKYQDPKLAAKALGIDLKTVEESWERLLQVGLVEQKNGQYQATSLATFAGEEVPSAALRNFHAGLISKALIAQEEQPFDRKEFVSVVFSLRSEDLKQMKDEIYQFQVNLTNKYAQKKNKDSVYCLSTQLFDLVQNSPLAENVK